MNLNQWALKWGIPPGAMQELKESLGITTGATATSSGSEASVQQKIRLAAPGLGVTLWRNNNGACMADNRMIRYGLANDSKAMNDKIKSHDLIGITPYVVSPQDVGRTLGVFTSIETKRAGWVYTGTPREQAQLNWSLLVTGLGGLACFATSVEEAFKP